MLLFSYRESEICVIKTAHSIKSTTSHKYVLVHSPIKKYYHPYRMLVISTEFHGSVGQSISELAGESKVNLNRAKINFAMDRIKGYINRQTHIKQRNLELRIMLEKRKRK